MKIAFNPSTVAALTTPPNNKDITFDLRGRNIFARGVKFYGTDTNTWRDIKINNVSIGSHTLDLRNGSNTTLTNTNGVVTINSTWRPVVDNLTSDSTTSSLSAKQGKVLKALIDGKSNSDHNHDGRYVRYYAVTTLDCNNLAAGLTAARISATNAAHTNHSAYLYISDVGTPFQIQIPDSSIPYIYKRYYGSGKWSGWFKLNAGYADSAGSVAWANVTGKPSSYTPSAHTHAWNSLTHSSTTENQAILTNGKANGWKLQTLNIARWDNAANNAHSHANKSVLDGITSALVNSWNTAYNFVSNITGTDTDKVINKWEEIVNFLAGITEDNKLNTLLNSKLSIQQLSAKDILTTKTNNALFWVDTKGNASTITTGPFTDHPYALLSVTNYNQNAENYKFFYRSRLAFSSAGDIKVASCHHENEYQQDETWYNVLTSKNSGINGSTIKLNGTSITVYSSGTADGRYVKKSGDTMSGVLTIDTTNFGALTIKRNDDANGASIQFRGKSSVYGYIGLNNSTKDKQFLRWSSDTSRVYTILDTSSTYISNGKGVINGTTITQVDNATNSTNSTNARKLVNWYSARPTSLNAQFGDGSLRIFYATSSTTEGKPAEDSHILHLAWDNTGGYDAQLAVHAHSGKVSTRAQNAGTWQPWKTLAFITDIPTSLKNPYSFNVFGVVYDGSTAKTVTTSNFISQVNEGTSTITDGTMLITSYASNSGFADTNAVNIPYKRKAIHLWEYIKAKTDSLYATNGHNHDGKYLKLTGGTMLGALNFANSTWNLVGDDSYIGDCNISGHFGIKAANTTYPGITFFNNANTFLGNLTAYSGNIKYGAYSLQFLDNGNTSVSASTWINPFSDYNSNAVADGQAICVWGQASQLSNLSTDAGDMTLWLRRVNAKVATLNMVLDGEYYAQGSQRLAHVSEIPNKDSWNYDDRYLRLTGGWMSGDINFGGDNKIHWGRNTDSASISFKNDGDGDANSYMSFVTSDNGNEYFRWSHSSGSTNTEWMALRSDGLRVRGTKVSLEGHTHDDRYYTKAESNAKYITDITTSVNKLTFTRNGSNIARNITVNVVHSQGYLTNIPNKDATTKASPGLFIYNSYNQVIGTNSYSSVLSINTGGTIQIAGNWGDDQTRNLYWRSQSDRNVADYPWKSWRTILDSENYSSTLDSRYYTESEVNSLLDAKLNRQNLSYGNWNPRGYHLAADYHYNGGDLSISESGGKIHVSVDGYFWQNEGQYRVLDTSDVAGLKSNLTVHQYLSATDAAWYPLVWGGNAHLNTSDSTGAVYKSYDKLSWQTSSQTLYATNIQTNNIKNLSIGGGIYWNPYVESASDGSDAASITLVRSGVAGGTTLVLSQMNDTNDTIQFKTNTAARLYHNSYPILTTQNTYVSNNKGYIYGNEITQVNNSDTLDNWHKDNIQWTGYITSSNSLSSYWFKMYQITVTGYQYNDITITFLVSEGYSKHFSIFHLKIRQNGTNHSGNYNLGVELRELVGNLRDKVVAYYNNSTGDVQLWGNPNGQYNTMNYTVLKKTTRIATDSSSLGILTAQSFSSVQTPPSTGYTRVTMARVGSVSYSDSTGSVHWNNVTNKPSTFNPAAHTHTVFKNNLMIKGTNGISDSASIHLGIGDSDTGFKWISDGVCQIYANNAAVGQWTSGGMDWFKNPTVNGNKVWNAGNDGSGSGLDADTLDGYHAASFVKMYTGKFNQYNEGTWTKILQFTIPSGDLQPTISFIWHPTECARDVWADFNINIRSGSPIFYVNWKGTTRRTVYCVGDGTTYSVWVQGTKSQYDPFGLVQVISTWQINTYQAGSLQYSDSEPTGTYKVVASMSGIIMYADRLLTARKINGTSFDGTSDITTAYWGTTRTISLTGAITGSVSTNGGGNITINTTYGTGNITNLDNRYVKKAGDTMQGNLTFTSGKQTRWTAHGTSYITDGNVDSGTSLGGDLANLVISSWCGVSFTTSCSGQTYTNKTAVGINCRTGIVYAANFVGPLQGNAATATKLQTPRSIWGQSFDGTRDVSGTLSGVANIQFSADGAYDIGSNSATSRYIYTHWLGAKSGSKLELGANNSGFGQGLCIDTNLNVGIGTNSPTQKLDVIGNIRATGQLYLPTNGNYNAILMGDDCWMGDCNISNVIGLSGTNNANSGGIKFGKGGMYIGYNGSSHYSSGTSLWTNFNADTVDGEHASNFSYTHQSSFDFSKRKSGRIVTFDQSGTDYGWINGFASTYNNYLTSVIFNEHRSSNWYVGYMEGDMSTGETNGLQAVHKLAFADGDESYPIFLGYLNLYNGNDGTISSSFPCLGYSVPFTYTRGGAYCLINIPNTSFQTFYIKAAIASVHYSGAGMGHLVGNHRGDGAWWLHCDAVGSNAVQVKGFHLANKNNDSWWGGNPLYSGDGAAKIITVCLFGHVKYK